MRLPEKAARFPAELKKTAMSAEIFQLVFKALRNFSAKYFLEKECPRGYPIRPNFLIFQGLFVR